MHGTAGLTSLGLEGNKETGFVLVCVQCGLP